MSASFFFWNPGSSLQKSLTGLLRSLLYHVLQSAPDLIPQICPELWGRARSATQDKMDKANFSDKEAREVFLRLVSNAKACEDRCYCFFIDGLDEYEGTHQDDAKFLVDQLLSWTTASANAVKLCVSSREYNLFMNSFPESNRVRLHRLTESDMPHYASDRLGHMKAGMPVGSTYASTFSRPCGHPIGAEGGDRDALVKHIVDNANGIFLWVVLVTKRLRELLENGLGFNELLRELHVLPKELDELFVQLLGSLPKSDRRRAYQIFSIRLTMMDGANSHGGIWPCSFTLLSTAYLDEYSVDPQFAMRESSYPSELDPNDLVIRLDLASKKLSGCPRGLVELVEVIFMQEPVEVLPSQELPRIHTVDFTHRSIAEFLSEREEGRCNLGEFNAVDAASQVVLAEAFACPRLAFQGRSYHAVFPTLTAWRADFGLDSSSHSFLEAMTAAVLRARSKHCEYWFPKPPVRRYPGAKLAHFQANVYKCGSKYRELAFCRKAGPLEAVGATPPVLPIYEAARPENWGFVKWKLRQPSSVCPQISLEILLYCILDIADWDRTVEEEEEVEKVCGVMDILIAKGLAPQTRTSISPVIHHMRPEFHLEGSDVNMEMTVWQHLLILCYLYTAQQLMYRMPRMGRALEKLLRHGADTHFQFSAVRREGWTNDDDLEDDTDDSYQEPYTKAVKTAKQNWASFVLRLVLGKE